MNKIYLVRHGNKPQIAGDPTLSNLGIKQARETAKYFKDKNISQIYSSPLARTKQTAQIIAQDLNINNIIFDNRLKERFNWGDDPSQSFEEFLLEWRKTTLQRNYQPSTGNSSWDAGNKLKGLIDELIAGNNGKSSLLITHGGVITDLLRNLFNDTYLKRFSHNFLNKGIAECSITLLVINKGVFTLKEFDFVGHLPQSLELWGPSW